MYLQEAAKVGAEFSGGAIGFDGGEETTKTCSRKALQSSSSITRAASGPSRLVHG